MKYIWPTATYRSHQHREHQELGSTVVTAHTHTHTLPWFYTARILLYGKKGIYIVWRPLCLLKVIMSSPSDAASRCDIWCAERHNVSLRAMSHCVAVAQNQFVSLCAQHHTVSLCAQRDVVPLYGRVCVRARACYVTLWHCNGTRVRN
jgi:hypothetical protein